MNDERQLLSLRRPTLRTSTNRLMSLHDLPRAAVEAQGQKAFEQTLAAKIRAAASQDALDAQAVSSIRAPRVESVTPGALFSCV